MKAFRPIAFLVLFMASLVLLAGCDIFSTREEEKPEEPRSDYEVPFRAEILISNFSKSLLQKNVQNYLASFADSSFSSAPYTFVPSAGSQAQYPELAQGWNRQNESDFFNNLVTKVTQDLPITISFSDTLLIPLADSAEFSSRYTLSVPHRDPVFPTVFQGEMRLKLVRDQRLIWVIREWQDIKNSSLPTFSELKGYFY